jgi:isopenicillin-N epimerase
VVRAHNSALAGYGQEVVGAALGLDRAELPQPGDPDVAMRIVPLPSGLATSSAEALALRQYLSDKLSAEVQVSSWNGRGLLRLSAQVYNRADDYDRFAERLPAALGSYPG